MTRTMSLRLRLTLLSGLLTGVTILVFAITFQILLEAALLREIDRDLRTRAALVQRTLRLTGAPGVPSEIGSPSAFEEFAAPGIYVQVIAPDGATIARSPNLPQGSL